MLLGVLEEEGGLAHTTGAPYSYHTAAPINLVHQQTPHRGIGMLHKIGVSAEKGFHLHLQLF